VEPTERNAGFEFVDEISAARSPASTCRPSKRASATCWRKGAIAGFPLQDIRVRVYDGKPHPVDARKSLPDRREILPPKKRWSRPNPLLLEPIVTLEVTVPGQFVGDITGDLSGRRGRILGQDMLPGNMTIIKAQVPLAEVAQSQLAAPVRHRRPGQLTR